jgi:hypothetical protein
LLYRGNGQGTTVRGSRHFADPDGYLIELCNAEQRRRNVAACSLEDAVSCELLSAAGGDFPDKQGENRELSISWVVLEPALAE